ncbi:hypothetical protein GCM10027299_10860 [Larkinella ripae]
MTRYLCVLCLLIARLTATHAQPLLARNTPGRATDATTNPTAPRSPKATESPVYIKVYGFYGLITPGAQFRTSSSLNMAGAATSYKVNTRGLGAGPRAGAGVGVIVSDFINLGIDADVLIGEKLTNDNVYVGSNYTYTSTSSVQFKVLSVIPNITFKALSRPSFYIYNRLGLVGGFVLDYATTSNSLNTPNTGNKTIYENRDEYQKNTLAVGYQAALGIQFRISQRLRGFAEVVGYNQSFQPKEAHTTYSSKVGNAATQTTKGIRYYKREGDYISTQIGDTNVDEMPRTNLSMNSIGVGVGLVFRF